MALLRPYFLHLRPRSWPIVALHFCVGAVVIHGLRWPAINTVLQAMAGAILWAIFLNGGTLALNSHIDRDEGDIGYLDNPPLVPEGLWTVALTMMAIGLLCAVFLPLWFLTVYAACFAMSIIYSVPPIRLKAVAGFDLLINAIGYGALTFLAGWAVLSSGPPGLKIILLAVAFAFLFACFYPLTQIYQYFSDKSRAVKTLTVHLGPRRVLHLSIIFLLLSFLLFTYTWLGFMGRPLWLWGIIVVAFLLWLYLLLDWLRRLESYKGKKGMYRALWLWGLVDILVVLLFA